MGAGSGEAFCLKKPDPSSGGSQDPKDHEKDEDADHALAFSMLLASGYVCTAAGIVVFKLHWITSNRIFKPFSAGRAFYPFVGLWVCFTYYNIISRKVLWESVKKSNNPAL